MAVMHSGSSVPDKSGIFVDNNLSLELKEAFVGGGIADPNKGTSFRLSLQSKKDDSESTAIRKGGNNPEVFITGFRYKDKKYSKPGEFVNKIVLHHPQELNIELEQGRYMGTNPDVKSVTFHVFDIYVDKPQIFISIEMQSGKKIDIAYSGKMPYDGLY